MKHTISAAALFAALGAGGVHAQTTIIDLSEIVVSGGFTPIPAARYGRAATLVTAEEIEKRGLASVQDALRALPGVAVSSGSGNTFTQVRIRGGEANHTLILIDGIEAAGGDGEYILSGLELANVERIEVLRGPQSVFYGSNASSGVINIVTRRGGEGTEFRASAEGGGGNRASVFASQRGERGGLSFSLSAADDRGFDVSGDNGERDDTRRNTAILSGDFAVTGALTLGFTWREAREDFDYDANNFAATDAESYVVDDPALFAERDERTFGAFAEYAMMGGRMTHRLGYELTLNTQSDRGFDPVRTETEALKYRLSYALDGGSVEDADQTLAFFLENERDASSTNPAFAREALSAAVEYRGSFGEAFDMQAGLRYDDNEVFGDATTWTLALSYGFAGGMRLHASAGAGVVNPTYFELFANAFGFVGNPDLRPERNRGYDIGLEMPILGGRGTLDVTYFDETLIDEITSVPSGGGFTFENQTGESERRGVEISARLEATERLDLDLAYTYLEAENPDGSREIRRPRHELAFGATLETFGGRGSATARLRHVAGNADTQFWGAFETVELPDYTTVDLSARYALTDAVDLTGRVTNLFDAETSDAWGYAGRERTFYLGLDARF